MAKEKFIQKAIKHPGALHSQLGVKQGEKIPEAKMRSARAGNYGPKAQKRANFAKTLAGFHGGGDGVKSAVSGEGMLAKNSGPMTSTPLSDFRGLEATHAEMGVLNSGAAMNGGPEGHEGFYPNTIKTIKPDGEQFSRGSQPGRKTVTNPDGYGHHVMSTEVAPMARINELYSATYNDHKKAPAATEMNSHSSGARNNARSKE